MCDTAWNPHHVVQYQGSVMIVLIRSCLVVDCKTTEWYVYCIDQCGNAAVTCVVLMNTISIGYY